VCSLYTADSVYSNFIIMNKIFTNTCTRCGTERVVVRRWEEKYGNSVVINTEKSCPNPDCQKIVDSDNKKQQDKYAAIKMKSEERAMNRKAFRDANKVEKEAATQ
jgi:hypothetical protein